MSVVRRFLVAPALVRLIRKERGGGRITEGYFAAQAGRTSLVRVEGQVCHLILVNKAGDGAAAEERTEVPRAHGDALLDVCPGKAAYDRTSLALSGREVFVDRYVSPGALDLLSVAFDDPGEARGFAAPAWFGREVSDEAAYDRQALAVQGPPKGAPEVPLSNAALDAVLDLIEPRFSFNRFPAAAGGEEAGRRAPQPTAPAARPAQEAPRTEPSRTEAPRAETPKPEAPQAGPGEAARPQPAPPEPAQPAAPAGAPRRPEEPSVAQSMATASAAPEASQPGDARIEDVIESLSQALGAAIQQPPQGAGQGGSQSGSPGGEEDPTAAFERWTPRPRRTQPN